MNYSAPGVYIREESSGIKPIAGVGTSTAAFVGIAEKGVYGQAVLVTSWSNFNREFGGFMPNGYLAYAVYGFFAEGGTACYVVRCKAKESKAAQVEFAPAAGVKVKVTSRYDGEWGNKISVTLPATFKLQVKCGEKELEAYDNVTLERIEKNINGESPFIQVAVIGDKTQRPDNNNIQNLLKVTTVASGISVDIAKKAEQYTVVVKQGRNVLETFTGKLFAENSNEKALACITIKNNAGSPPEENESYHLDLSYGGSGIVKNLTISAKSLNVSVTDASRFDLTVNYDQEVKETFKNVSLQDLAVRINQSAATGGSRFITVAAVEGVNEQSQITQHGTYNLIGGTSKYDLGEGLTALDIVADVNIVAIPDAAGDRDVLLKGFEYCAKCKNHFFIADPPPGLSVLAMKAFKEGTGTYSGNAFASSYGAVYYPWVYLNVSDPVTGEKKVIPPSGVVAGTYAHTDAVRGVHKAPAGIDEGFLDTVVGVEKVVTRVEHELLNPAGINVIRRLPQGICIWGARTLSTDTEWNYINIRRLLQYIEAAVDRGTQWVVFEPNEPGLWGRVKRNLTAFLTRVWRDGALFGSSPEEAFFVKVDADNNPESERNLGELHIHVGVAPVRPAEFVVIHISQKTMEQQGRS